MTTGTILVAILILLAVVAWIWNQLRRTEPPPKARNPFRCVVIRFGVSPCPAVRKFAGKRILAYEAPLFPLPDCNRAHCECRYIHYPDRRQRLRRAQDSGLPQQVYLGVDRRTTPDRREDEPLW